MTVNADRDALLELMACPSCRSALRSSGAELVCTECARTYTVSDGVPVMLEDQGTDTTPSLLGRVQYAVLGSPRVYDMHQAVGGGRGIARHVERHLRPLGAGTLLDVGAGTGMARTLVSAETRYVWCDNDRLKLRGFLSKHTDSLAVLGDAVRLPFREGAADWTLLVEVSHHLPDAPFAACLGELARVTRQRLVFVDGLRGNRKRSNLLWKLDLGRHPRTEDELLAALEVEFSVDEIERFTINHDHVICVCTPRSAAPSPS